MSVFRLAVQGWTGKVSTSESGMYYFNLLIDLKCEWNDINLGLFPGGSAALLLSGIDEELLFL